MIKELSLLFAIFLVASHATPLESSSRNGLHNTYYLYTREHPRDPVRLEATAESVIRAQVLFRPKTAIIVHGHNANGFNSLNPVLKDVFLSNEDVNVIVIDWSVYASQSYSNAVKAVPSVGSAIAEFVRVLVKLNQVSLDRLHLIGFDLGAHVVGFTGRALDGKVARITGLDPSLQQWGSKSQRLTKSDAVYVEVIHTDGSGILANGVGTPLGDIDFFANGGSSQPGCFTHSCSHERAWELFAASLESSHLIGNQCSNTLQLSLNTCRGVTVPMGNNDLIKYGSGIFRVNTGRKYPF